MNASMTPTETECQTDGSEAIQRPNFHAEENDDGATLQIALPGVHKDDLKLTFQESSLKIEGKRGVMLPLAKTNRLIRQIYRGSGYPRDPVLP